MAQPEVSRRRGVVMVAIAGIDIAIWDVKAQALGVPLYQALGAARRVIRGYASGGWAPGDEAEAELAGYAAKGFTAVKMRVVGRDGFSIAKCVRRVQAARRGLGPDVELMVDAHGSLEVTTAITLAKALEPYNIAWFEEPVSPDDHDGQAEVRRATTIPIASGEREFTRFDFQDLLDHHALDIAQPDIARAGGFTEIRRIAALTSTHGVRLAPHAWGSGILFAASIHMAMAAPNCHILEVSQGYMPMMWELFNESFDIRPDGTVHAPERPMAVVEIILIALVAVIALATLAQRLAIPYPILLVLGGLALGVAPGLPAVTFDPGLLFVLFVPPLVYALRTALGLLKDEGLEPRWRRHELNHKAFRAGIEANISCLKRAFGLGRCTWRGLAHFKSYVWSSVVAYNLALYARLAAT